MGGFYPIAVVGEANGNDDKDKDRDDGDHHHVGGEQCCQVVWFSAEWKKTVNNIQTTQHAKSKLISKPIETSHSQERERLSLYSKKKAFLSLLSA